MNMSIRNNATLTTLDNYCKAGFLQQSKEIRDAEKLREEFTGAMYMVGARKLADLCPDMVR